MFDVLAIAGSIGVPFLGAGGVLLVPDGRDHRRGARIALACATAAAALIAVAWLSAGPTVRWRRDWIEALGVSVGIYADGLSFLFASLIGLVSVLSTAYSYRYIPREAEHGRLTSGERTYYAALLLFTGAMYGVVFAIDLVQLFVLWELTGIASFVLIGLNWSTEKARHAARIAFITTGLGGIALLVGALVLAAATGTTSLPALLATHPTLAPPLGSALVALFLAGAATKSAQVPFHFWLPRVMVAPTPVSAFLHSASLVALGVYLLARVQPILAAAPLWPWAVGGVGLASVLVGGLQALRATELKGLLAYSTISQYGFIFLLLASPAPSAVLAALHSFFHHGLVKAGLFYAAGIVTYATGRTLLGQAGLLWRAMPVPFAATAILALAMGGVPPLIGFWMKESMLAAVLATGNPVLLAVTVAASALTLAYMLRFLVGAFIAGEPSAAGPISVPPTMSAAVVLLAALSVALGVLPSATARALVEPAASAVVREPAALDLALHPDAKLLASLVALAAGVALVATHGRWVGLLDRGAGLMSGPARALVAAAALSERGASITRDLQAGLLPRYVQIVLAAFVGLLAFATAPALVSAGFSLPALTSPALGDSRTVALAVLLLVIVAGTVLTVVMRRHVHIVLALGAVGYAIGGVFALELAPDVGLVQVHVETLVTVLFVIGLVLIPRRVRERVAISPLRHPGGATVALAGALGIGATWVSWLAIEHRPRESVAAWYTEHAATVVRADDVVTAILVEFRALDTLGEIVVFAIAAIGVRALVQLARREPA